MKLATSFSSSNGKIGLILSSLPRTKGSNTNRPCIPTATRLLSCRYRDLSGEGSIVQHPNWLRSFRNRQRTGEHFYPTNHFADAIHAFHPRVVITKLHSDLVFPRRDFGYPFIEIAAVFIAGFWSVLPQFLDLFSGSGAVGVEALSRGAGHATFVDFARDCCEVKQKTPKLFFFQDT